MLSERATDLLCARGFEVDARRSEPAFDDRLDTALMALFRDDGGSDVFEALYQRTRGMVFDTVRRVVGERRLALDPLELVQDTFVNVYRYAKGFRDEHPTSFRAWVRTIAHHTVCRAAARRAARALPSLAEGLDEPADPRPAPLGSLFESEDAGALHESWMLFLAHYARAFDALSPRDRRALELVELEGATYEQAASELRVGRSNMKMILFRARSRIQNHMRRSMAVEPEFEFRARAIAV